MELKYRMIDDDPIESANTNVAIAAVTTGWARVWLYEAMLKAGLDNVHYCDTDSIIYSHPKGNNPIKTDSCLGGWTNELNPGSYITELICMAPKTYAYKTSDGNLEVKAKGFSLNRVVSETINFETMRDMVLRKNDEKHIIAYPRRIRLQADTKLLRSVDETKTFRYDYTKREVGVLNETQTRIPTTAY